MFKSTCGDFRNLKGDRKMRRISRKTFCLCFTLLLAALLSSCGSKSEETETNLFSSTVYGEHSLAIGSGNVLKSWGANGYGQLGLGSRLDKSLPKTVEISFTPVSFAAGGAHGVAVSADGTVYAWGLNGSGQLGDGTTTTRSTPVPVLDTDGVTPLSGIVAIAAGGRHTLALKNDGTVLAWGSNTKGQLGNDSTIGSKLPVQVAALESVTAIAAGGEFSLALRSDGTVWAWGSNAKGQLGDGTTTNSLVPVKVQIQKSSSDVVIKAIAAGGSHALAIDEDGKVWAWGYNFFGQLGNNSAVDSNTAIEVFMPSTGSVATSIAAGLDHSLAVIDNKVYAWGYNKNGQVGNGAEMNTEIPVRIPTNVIDGGRNPLVNFLTVTAGGYHSMARDIGGKLWTWGRNAHGQLGTGNRNSRSYAAEVANL